MRSLDLASRRRAHEGIARARRTTLVVPCYNEWKRLDLMAFRSMLEARPELGLVFVDDGSCDGTRERLGPLVADYPGRVELLARPSNQGKAEAVRAGLRHALAAKGHGSLLVGYFDADLATPPSEIFRLLDLLRSRDDIDVLMASRMALLGHTVERHTTRHYTGRVFATAASLILRLPVHDTQCGAKLFRPSPALHHALAEPFLSRWAFDVELLGRMLTAPARTGPLEATRIREEPLLVWHAVEGSKVDTKAVLVSACDTLRIAADLRMRRWRRA